MLICDHIFHRTCLEEWKRKALAMVDEASCPICRSQIFDKSEVQCMYCRDYFTYNPDNKAFCFQCTVPSWFLFTKTVNHYMHTRCLLEYIRTNSRRNDKGQDVFRCLVHRMDHLVPVNCNVASCGFKSIEREEDIHPELCKPPQKAPPIDAYRKAVKKTGL